MNKNKLIVFSAPSGAGKTTLVKHILSQFSNTNFSISATSRSPRGNEKDGVDYHFLSNSEFKKKIENNEFVEFEEVYGGVYYGTLKSEVENIWANNKIVLFDIDVVGGFNIKKMYPDNTLSIFVMPPSIYTLRKRLVSRGDISDNEINRRIKKAELELDFASKFDKIIINSDLEESKKIASNLVNEFIKNE
ncbi:MAG: guanylate kinase [Candidatus Marisimplicoccus sp.]|jgi:guanylate kinase|tara:strand:- start:359 stop:931 length:573 start_codon:yes stop_codon:yes gene_type:complete